MSADYGDIPYNLRLGVGDATFAGKVASPTINIEHHKIMMTNIVGITCLGDTVSLQKVNINIP